MIDKTLGHKHQQATAIYARVTKDVARTSMEGAVNAVLRYKFVAEEAELNNIKGAGVIDLTKAQTLIAEETKLKAIEAEGVSTY